MSLLFFNSYTYANNVPAPPFPAGYSFILQDVTTGNYLGLSGNQVVPVTLSNAITWQVKNDAAVYNNSLGGIALQAISGTNFNGNYMRHAGFVIYADAFVSNNLDFAWRFDLASGNNIFIVFNWFGSPNYYLGFNSSTSRYEIVTTTPRRQFRVVTSNTIIPTDFSVYINASTTLNGASTPTLSGSSVTSWGLFTGASGNGGTARPQYFATGGPKNGPRVNFPGPSASGNAYMTCSISCNGTIKGGMTTFYYLKDTSVTTRLFLASGYIVDLQGNNFFFGNFTNNAGGYVPASGSVSMPAGQFNTLCHRLYNISGTQCTQDLFVNGVLAATRTTNFQAQNATFTRFGQSEFGDTFNDAYWQGDLAALLLYPRSLTNAEITNIHNALTA